MNILNPYKVSCNNCNNIYNVIIFLDQISKNKKDYLVGNTQPDKEAGIGTRQLYKKNCPVCSIIDFQIIDKLSWDNFYKS